MDRVKRIWYLSPMRAAKVQASLRIRAVSPEPPLLAHTSRESKGIFRQKARSLAPLNGWACAVKICHVGMLEDTNSLDAPRHMIRLNNNCQKSLPWVLSSVQWYTLVQRQETGSVSADTRTRTDRKPECRRWLPCWCVLSETVVRLSCSFLLYKNR